METKTDEPDLDQDVRETGDLGVPGLRVVFINPKVLRRTLFGLRFGVIRLKFLSAVLACVVVVALFILLRPLRRVPPPSSRLVTTAPPFPMNACPAVSSSLLALFLQDNSTAVHMHLAFLFRASIQRRSAEQAFAPGQGTRTRTRSGRHFPGSGPGPALRNRTGRGARPSGRSASAILCYLMFAFLVVSAIASAVEVLKERKQGKGARELTLSGAGAGVGMSPVESCSLTRRSSSSLVDLTVSRHVRRESQAAAIQHNAMHHGVGRPTIGTCLGTRPVQFSRRRSFPAPPPGSPCPCPGPSPSPSHSSPVPVPVPPAGRRSTWSSGCGSSPLVGLRSRRLSGDVSDGDSSPDSGRRVRFIRRH